MKTSKKPKTTSKSYTIRAWASNIWKLHDMKYITGDELTQLIELNQKIIERHTQQTYGMEKKMDN